MARTKQTSGLGPRGQGRQKLQKLASRAIADEAFARAFQQVQVAGTGSHHPAAQRMALLSAARPDDLQVDVDSFLSSFTH
jgi:hypothetical protein